MRIIRWPRGLPIARIQWGDGPEVRGATESVTNFRQVSASPTGLVRLSIGFAPLQGQVTGRQGRVFDGIFTALGGGGHVLALPIRDAVEPTFDELGISGRQDQALTWGNGKTWGNGSYWRAGPPVVPVIAAAAERTTIVSLNIAKWGGAFTIGTRFGFVGQYGVYQVEDVTIAGNGGTARVWPPLRRPITTADHATLRPVLACQLADRRRAHLIERWSVVSGGTMALVEVPDPVVRQYAVRDRPPAVYVAPPASSDWILATGAWNDAGRWDDTAVWNDG